MYIGTENENEDENTITELKKKTILNRGKLLIEEISNKFADVQERLFWQNRSILILRNPHPITITRRVNYSLTKGITISRILQCQQLWLQ
jgi:hypothetical protein